MRRDISKDWAVVVLEGKDHESVNEVSRFLAVLFDWSTELKRQYL